MNLEHYGTWIKFSNPNSKGEFVQIENLTRKIFQEKLDLYGHSWLYINGEYLYFSDARTERYMESYFGKLN